MINCSGCGTTVIKSICPAVLNYIHYCPMCVRKILIIHTYIHDIKFLCPHCGENEEKCQYCNLDSLLKNIEDVYDTEDVENEI